MSDLQNLTPANTYKALLQLGDYTNGISGDTGANALQVSDGAGNNTSLALSTDRVGIGNTSPSAELDVSGDVVADEYALDQTGSSSSAVAIHAPATNELAIRTNSTEAMRIDSNGQVGIGTASPSSDLHIASSLATIRLEDSDVAGGVAYSLITSSSAGNITLSSDPDNARSTSDIRFDIDGTERMRIDSAGNVGINTTSPSASLHIVEDDATNVNQLKIDYNGGGGSSVYSAALLYLTQDSSGGTLFRPYISADDKFTVTVAGDVGIGTTSPSRPLEVHVDSGDLYSSGASGNILRLRNMKEDTANSHCGIDLFAGVSTVSGSNPLARIHAVAENAVDGKCALTFQTRTTSAISEAMRIDSNGNVGIGTTTPSAPLEVTSTTGGVIMPRMTTTQMNAISSPTDGEMIYNTTANKFYGRANGAWVALH